MYLTMNRCFFLKSLMEYTCTQNIFSTGNILMGKGSLQYSMHGDYPTHRKK